ncbi:FAD-binding oxidoreductase [Jannaschia sp. W003]|uniref:FAD-binding oxidoreductase n=1 Tax=Jannaschia sp. W003 TaxID=2867012 RepID=UPI0021A4F1F2|nr:FAD-binding oxidoreductase [Jannaschia sp. W003]UWQ21138.1 FAD-binding oxidoreductase [Jannaschia sp. W003]
MTITLNTLDGGTAAIGDDAVDALAATLRGAVLRPGEAGYDAARALWNGMFDPRPGLVIRALGTADIRTAVRFARDGDLRIAVRGGGHQIAGLACEEGSLLLDLSQMRSVHVDSERRVVQCDPGALLGDLDRETQLYGLAVPTGINSTTGVAGLTLGGGFGWITRKHGLTVDNLLAVDIVTADGRLLRASERENPDLFWAVRGGGGNFGVVTSFEFRAHPVGPEVLSGLVVHPIADAPNLLRAVRRICGEAPDELTVWSVMRGAPPLPFLPEAWHGRPVLILAACYAGDMREGEAAMRALRNLGDPVADVIAPHPFAGWQAAFDPLLTPGARNYWKSHDFTDLSDGAIDAILGAVDHLPDPACEIFIAHVGGAMARVAPDATAFPQRNAHFTMNVHTRWEDPAKDKACLRWARDLYAATAPFSAGSVYVNFVPGDEPGRLAEAYGANMERLRAVKARYDPHNLFRVNHNIEPAREAVAAQ